MVEPSAGLFSNWDHLKSKQLAHEPPDIYLDNHIFDLKFSPASNVLALG